METADGQKPKGCREDMDISRVVQILNQICYDIKDLGVKYLTVYAFSTENWKRSREEVEGLMKLFRSYLKKCMKSAEKNHMRVKVIGDPTAFDQDIQDKIRKLWKSFRRIMMNYIFSLH